METIKISELQELQDLIGDEYVVVDNGQQTNKYLSNKLGKITDVTYDGTSLVTNGVAVLDSLANKTETNNLLDLKANKVDLVETNRNVQNLVKASIGKLIQFAERTYTAFRNLINEYAISTSLKEIDGRSVVGNQLNSGYQNNKTEGGITLVNNADGTVSITGTYDGTIAYNQFKITLSYPLMRDNRKYLLLANQVIPNKWGINGYESTANVDKQFFQKSVGTAWSGRIGLELTEGEIVDLQHLDFKIVDTRIMYGSDNEPSSLDDSKIEEVKRYLALHPEYDEGTIVSAENDKLEVVGKNLFNPENWIDSTTLGLNYGYINTFILEKGKTYCLKANASLSNPKAYTYLGAIIDGVYASFDTVSNADIYWSIGTEGQFAYNPKIFTMNKTCMCYVYGASTRYASKQDGQNRLKEVQLEEGSSPTSYSPYNKFSLDIPQEIQELDGYGISAGNVINKFSIEDKKFYRNVGKHTFNGTENWGYNYGVFFISIKNIISVKSSSDIRYLSNLYVATASLPSVAINVDKSFQIIQNGTYLSVRDDSITSLADWKSKLATTPMVVYYEQATPEVVDISSMLPEYFGQFNVEGNGTITIHNDNELDTTSKFENMEVIQ